MTDPELFETRDRIIDALNAVKMALKHVNIIHNLKFKGMLPGGSSAMIKAQLLLDHLILEN